MEAARVLRAGEAEVLRFDWGKLFWYASGKLGNSGKLTLGKCVIRPGAENPEHFHPNCEEVLHVLSGRIVHHMKGSTPVEMGPGDTITLPANLPHYAKNAGRDDAVMVIAFSSADRRMEKT